ncbi:MAG: ABC transporter substrate-binding protein [Melioribacteraceae bacterium]|nr:ABC transporter substrate-binding protein [Melioribacteraceae bacterium]
MLIKNLKYIVPTTIILLIALLLAIDFNTANGKGNSSQKETYSRIISLSPSTTETLFLLGLGDKVVGVTRFCGYPPEAKTKKEVGGYIDPNYEAIMQLNPDLVILLPEHEKVKKYLDQINIKYIMVDNKTVDDILNCIKTIGEICDAQEKAASVLADMNSTINEIELKTSGFTRKKVLVSVGRTFGSDSISDAYIAGKHTHYDELILIAGGTNAFTIENLSYPMLSAEGIIQINPDIIIDMAPNLSEQNLSEEKLLSDWDSITNLTTINKNNIYIYSKDYSSIPGPRIIYLLQDFAKIIHPEADWNF